MKKKGIVYKVQNKENGKVYIGATTKTVEERKQDHIQKSEIGTGSYFQEAIGTYGPGAFSWEQIDTANDINELATKEKQYNIEYKSLENGYNSDCGGGVQKNVYQYDMEDGRLIGTYDSLESAASAVSAANKSISNACLGYNKSCNGYYWSYTLTEPYVIPKDLRRKEVMQLDLYGNLIARFVSVSEASKYSGISKTCISRCCRGEREQSGGFLWNYI